MIDYKQAQKIHRSQKSQLTRAIRSGDPQKVVAAVRKAKAEWNGPAFNGAWPDDWHRWNMALYDATHQFIDEI
jgi:hypothetical protein